MPKREAKDSFLIYHSFFIFTDEKIVHGSRIFCEFNYFVRQSTYLTVISTRSYNKHSERNTQTCVELPQEVPLVINFNPCLAYENFTYLVKVNLLGKNQMANKSFPTMNELWSSSGCK
ncbi:CLUMA_CG017131, isoform A [Clunio marinus]|uniref:CLUMA_CG017131, isoform A n=1 Tax=Clunio marinus TaxID=568069 RepID=A0A1J1IUX1_9DIPT|nr:CLUMA_CG017131, isoform A [Clunio marinus]